MFGICILFLYFCLLTARDSSANLVELSVSTVMIFAKRNFDPIFPSIFLCDRDHNFVDTFIHLILECYRNSPTPLLQLYDFEKIRLDLVISNFSGPKKDFGNIPLK